MPPKRLMPDSYRVGWICPSEVEQIAAMEMLDEEHMPIEQDFTDHNVYKLGSINGHNVVIAGLNQTGNCSAATVVTQMRMTFKNLRYGLLVGIGGGVPVETDNGMIRLGHVVVSKPTGEHSGVIQFDHGKARNGLFERTGSIMPPPAVLLNAAQALAVQRDRMDYDPVWKDTLRFKTERRGLRQFKFPGIANDHLYLPDYDHQQQGMSCEKGGCSSEQRIPRPVGEDDDEAFIVVHRGNIASGELSIRDAKQRDGLAKQHGVLCFEMEAAGALTGFPCMVIRGISNYCDSHKNGIWDGFAAAAAAAYARQLFFHLPIDSEQGTFNSHYTPTAYRLPFYLPENRVPRFISRQEELAQMQKALRGTAQLRRVVVLHGSKGRGKTQLAIEYAQRHREDYSAIVWINARDETAINQSFVGLATWIFSYDPSANYISDAVQSKIQTEIVIAVKRWFDEPANDSWLIIYDNHLFPDPSILDTEDTRDTKDTSKDTRDTMDTSLIDKENASHTDSINSRKATTQRAFDIRKYIPESNHGAVIVTAPRFLSKLGHCIEIGMFEQVEDSLDLLSSSSCRENIRQDKSAVLLARQLSGHPLALASVGAYLKQASISCTEYLQLYEKSLTQMDETHPNLKSSFRTLSAIWNISLAHIEEQNANAALLLRQWVYFDCNDLWYELLQDGEYKPDWLRELTRDSLTFHTTMGLLCNYGLVQADIPNTPYTMDHTESDGYSVNSIVQYWMFYHVLDQKPCEEIARAAFHCVGFHAPNEEQPELWWSKQRRLLKHAEQCYDTMHIENEELGLLHAVAAIFAGQDRFSKAEAVFMRAIRKLEKACGPESKSTLITVYNLAGLYFYHDRLKEAQAMYERALRGFEKVQELEDGSIINTAVELRLDCLMSLGDICSKHGELQNARQYYLRAHEGLLQAFGAYSQDVMWLSKRLEEIIL